MPLADCLLKIWLFTLEGKIQVPEGKVEAIIREVHRQGHLGEHKTWKAFNRKVLYPSRQAKMPRGCANLP